MAEDVSRLRDDLELAEPLAAPVERLDRLRSIFETLEFQSLLPRLDALRG